MAKVCSGCGLYNCKCEKNNEHMHKPTRAMQERDKYEKAIEENRYQQEVEL